jgi:hypothetical protein
MGYEERIELLLEMHKRVTDVSIALKFKRFHIRIIVFRHEEELASIPNDIIGYFSAYLNLPTSLWFGVCSVSNRNEYQ